MEKKVDVVVADVVTMTEEKEVAAVVDVVNNPPKHING